MNLVDKRAQSKRWAFSTLLKGLNVVTEKSPMQQSFLPAGKFEYPDKRRRAGTAVLGRRGRRLGTPD